MASGMVMFMSKTKPSKPPAMHVATMKRRHGDREYTYHLLRQTYREGAKVRHRTLANLSHLPPDVIDLVSRVLKGDLPAVSSGTIEVVASAPHGHVAAVTTAARALGFPEILGPPSKERDIAFALIVARVLRPGSKAAASRWWTRTTLAQDLGLGGVGTDEAYGAMDWLIGRQDAIEGALAARHLVPGGLVLYDLSSSYVEGRHCELAARGYSRDRKRGFAQIEYGLVTDKEGRPISIEVFAGNTGDPSAFTSAVEIVRRRFGLKEVVMVGDRGMITTARIDALKGLEGTGWITALRAPAIKALAADDGPLQLSLFDETNLAEITHANYPGERLIACRNPALAIERSRKRTELLAATEIELGKVTAAVGAGRLKDPAKIGERVGRVANRYKVAKHFVLDIGEGYFAYEKKTDQIAAEAALDGIYVIRTTVGTETMSAGEVVETYKSLARVEAAFRSLKSVDLELRPIFHRLEGRVRAHALICMLAYYLVWHLKAAWAPLTFVDEDPLRRDDPVAKAKRSPKALSKASSGRTADGLIAHSFTEILDHLGEMARNTVRVGGVTEADVVTTPTEIQRRAFELLGVPVPQRCA